LSTEHRVAETRRARLSVAPIPARHSPCGRPSALSEEQPSLISSSLDLVAQTQRGHVLVGTPQTWLAHSLRAQQLPPAKDHCGELPQPEAPALPLLPEFLASLSELLLLLLLSYTLPGSPPLWHAIARPPSALRSRSHLPTCSLPDLLTPKSKGTSQSRRNDVKMEVPRMMVGTSLALQPALVAYS
jgi:hypothetical protein